MKATGTRVSALWNLLQYGASKVLLLVSTLVLARILAPEAFGQLALAMLAVNVFDRFKDLGVGTAFVQSPRGRGALLPTAMTLSSVSAVVLAWLCFLSAPLIASGFHSPSLDPVVRALSLMVMISGFSILPDALLRRELLFKDRTVPELAGAVVKAAGSIALAVAGMGVYSLVWGQVAGSLVTTVGYWLAVRRADIPRYGFGWEPRVAREMVTFGGSLVWLSLLSLALDNADYVVIGRRLGETELGQYTVAFRLPELLVTGVCIVIGQVLLSSFSRLQHDLPQLRASFQSATRLVAMVTTPIGLGLTASAPSIVPVLFGNQYPDAAGILQFLGIYSVAYALSFHAGEVYKAINRVGILLWLATIKIVIMIPLFWVAAGHSARAVAASLALMHIVFTGLRLFIVRRQLHMSLREQLGAITPSLGAGTAMAAAVAGLEWVLRDLAPGWRLPLDVLVGAVVYIGALRILDPAHANVAAAKALVRPTPAPLPTPSPSRTEAQHVHHES